MPEKIAAASNWNLLFHTPAVSPLSVREKIRTALSASLAIFLAGWIAGRYVDGGGLKTLLASMGASAVILFAMPHSPVARPWALVGGHFVSAITGILCARWVPDPWPSAALAVGLSILAMHSARCLHPPGGATSFIPVLGGESIRSLGFQFLVTPLALNVGVMLLVSLAYQRWLLPRPVPLSVQPGADVHRSLERPGIQTEDIHAALGEMNEFIDVDERELNEIYNLAAARAFRRKFGEATAAEVMTPNPLTVEFGDELESAWRLMEEHRIKALPVIDRGRHVIGIVTQSDFFRHARAKDFNTLGGKLKELLKPSGTVTSQEPEVVGQIMTAPVVTAAHTLNLPELARLLTGRGIHQLPIVDERSKLVGLIAQTDLIAALYQSMVGGQESCGQQASDLP